MDNVEKDPVASASATEGRTRQTGSPGVKRTRDRKEKTTKETDKALLKKINLALAQTIASKEDWEAAKAPEMLSVKEQKYHNFAKSLPGAGVNTVAQMISKATAVGSIEAFRDWQDILKIWRRQHSSGRKLFHRVAVAQTNLAALAYDGAVPGSQALSQTQMVLSQSQDAQALDDHGLTVLQRERFKYRVADAQKSRVDSIADEMRQRWKLDTLYEEYTALEREMRELDNGTGARGRRYDSVAKEHLFRIAYETDDGHMPTKEANPELWTDFGQLLDWGRRWNILKVLTGSVGIFGLLPKNAILNSWIERQLTQTRVRQWIGMVLECNPDVPLIAARIEPLFLACMQESKPPSEFMFLERLDDYQISRPLSLFNRVLQEGGNNQEEHTQGSVQIIKETEISTLDNASPKEGVL
ncbi:hypothetical protein B5807_02968 [Epicoccum nigrum]|uniref:Uncharacterized protein n=1 Tax=Epicoccum nigrum TaxID=105696 RepID=A0A1Y2MDD7_EPING|nr:hypothetical protein B5807_02968 [Epicoccum nigrum]